MRGSKTFAPIAVGFFALALPLVVAAFFAGRTAGAVANLLCAALFVLLGGMLLRVRG